MPKRTRLSRPRVLGIVLAGGEGKRLMPLTLDRAKPAVPFGGGHRMIDFVLSNLVNGGIHKIAVLTQYKSHSLDRHISTAWRLASLTGGYVTPAPDSTCWSIICAGSIRYTLSAPNTATMSGCSSWIRFMLW